MTKIVLLIRSLNVGGAEVQLANLAGGLSNRGLDLRVVVFYDGGLLKARLEELGVTVVSLKKKGRWDFIVFGYKFLLKNCGVSKYFKIVAMSIASLFSPKVS